MLAYEFISIKSKIGVEFRRYALRRQDVQSFDSFYQQIEKFHQLGAIPFVIFYVDPEDFLLPINNDDNLAKAISSAKLITLYDHHTNFTTTTTPSITNLGGGGDKVNNFNNNNNQQQQQQQQQQANASSNGQTPSDYHHNGTQNHQQQHNHHHHHHHNFHQTHHHHTAPQVPVILRRPFLKLLIEKKGIFLDYYNGNLSGKYKKSHAPFKGISNLILPSHHDQSHHSQRPSIGMPEDFRQVSSIIDVDIVPETCRRVRIVKHGSERPLGFYIRDGTYKRMNAQGQMELVTGIFISRLVPGGLAESTGLLAVNDEVLEVNGIQVTHGKTLDQVTDMMVANSSNLIITIRPGKLNNLT